METINIIFPSQIDSWRPNKQRNARLQNYLHEKLTNQYFFPFFLNHSTALNGRLPEAPKLAFSLAWLPNTGWNVSVLGCQTSTILLLMRQSSFYIYLICKYYFDLKNESSVSVHVNIKYIRCMTTMTCIILLCFFMFYTV